MKSQKGGLVSRKRGQKEGLGGQGPKRRAWEAPPPKRGQFGSYAHNAGIDRIKNCMNSQTYRVCSY